MIRSKYIRSEIPDNFTIICVLHVGLVRLKLNSTSKFYYTFSVTAIVRSINVKLFHLILVNFVRVVGQFLIENA